MAAALSGVIPRSAAAPVAHRWTPLRVEATSSLMASHYYKDLSHYT
jgi:hypothetical protein